jgi:hypothetical protein
MKSRKTAAAIFKHVPPEPRGSFILHFYAAVYHLIGYLRRLDQAGGENLDQTFEKYPFLTGYFAEMSPYFPEGLTWQAAADWWEREIAAWEETIPHHLPLRALGQEVGLDFPSRLALMIVALVEEDSRFGAIFAHIQSPLRSRRPVLELVGQIMSGAEQGRDVDPWAVCRPLLLAGLVEVLDKEVPRSEWELRVPALIWDVIRGESEPQLDSGCRYWPARDFPAIEQLIAPADFLPRLQRIPLLIGQGKVESVVLRCGRGSDGRRVMGALARTLGRGLIVVDMEGSPDRVPQEYVNHLGVLCSMARAMPVFHYDLGPGETADLPVLTGYRGPTGVIKGSVGGLKGEALDRAVSLTLPVLDIPSRLRCWQETLDGREVEHIHDIAGRFRLPDGYIRQVASMAVAHAALEGRGPIGPADVQEACRSLNRQQLDALASRLTAEGNWDRLVVSGTASSRLRELEFRCRHREKLLHNLGPAFGSDGSCGVRALFSGASGTGKTLAARILAARLGMDLYRVDLAAIVNKYIGETEKNLHRVLSRAEELDVILLLDEGDALLGRRTEVRTSNDRYANLETDYLLQALEHYQGIVVVTTNAGENIDKAFQRRMDVVVHFIPPGVQERLHIWQLHLPENHTVGGDLLEEVAFRCALTGGQIRSAALGASVLAIADDGGIVKNRHLRQAVHSEYRKAGAICPLNTHDRDSAEQAGLETFLSMMKS